MAGPRERRERSTAAETAGALRTARGIAEAAAKGRIFPLAAAAVLPLVLLAMLPSVIFGPLRSDGTGAPNGFVSGPALSDNLARLDAAVSGALSDGLSDTLERIEADFAASGRDAKEIVIPDGAADASRGAGAVVAQYCASKSADAGGISGEDLADILDRNRACLYSFTFEDTVREVPAEEPGTADGSAEPVFETVRVYTVAYCGEQFLADRVFCLSGEQKVLAVQYAQNLSLLLGDGVYQGLHGAEAAAGSTSYEGVVFTDGPVRVTYYSQLDRRWKDLPYGTDDIGGYGCGPTAMAIVVSSLTPDPADPPRMARWAYEHGCWCSGSGSRHSLIPKAAEAWGLKTESCTAGEPQRITDALRDGKLVVAIMGRGHFTKSGHFIVLRGVTPSGAVLTADPASCSRSRREWDLNVILKEAGKQTGAGGPFWIIGK